MLKAPLPSVNVGGVPPPTAELPAAIAAGDQLAAALAYRALGVSTFPIRADGSKAPAFAGWRAAADRLVPVDELRTWFRTPGRFGLGVTGGPASGNLAVLDFETWPAFAAWGRCLTPDQRAALKRSPVVGTPRGGAHVYCRAAEPVGGCKLARTAEGVTLIEVRGRQHFVAAPGSPPACHAAGRPWHVLRLGWLDGGQWEPLPLAVWHELTLHAVALNAYTRPAAREVVGDRSGSATGDRPGDHFNDRVSWGDVLDPAGWRVFRTAGAVSYWTRPGKAGGVSASTGHCRGPSGRDLLYVFSTSAVPFEAELSYSRFGAYALLNHRGDFRAATRALGLAGYGLSIRKGARW